MNKKGNDDIICFGFDVGTGNLACTSSIGSETKILRNAFIKISHDDIDAQSLKDISYIQDSNNDFLILGSDAFTFANVFNSEISRPMAKGTISPAEVDAIDILSLMVKSLIGDLNGKKGYVCYSVPAEPVDSLRNILYHEKVFNRIFKECGLECKPVNEGLAVLFSEAAEFSFTGIGLSFGAGLTNCCVGIKGVPAASFSTSRSGDWIDSMSSENLNIVKNRICNIKEKYLNLIDGEFQKEPDKKRRRALESLNYYYESFLNYTIKLIIKEFETNIDLEIGHPIPIILSGGTSLPVGFLEKFRSIISTHKLPFEISEIRHAKNPLTAVSTGLLVKAMTDID